MRMEVFVQGANSPDCPDQGSWLRQGRVAPHLTAQAQTRAAAGHHISTAAHCRLGNEEFHTLGALSDA
jgi:hypothetical protein